MSRGQLVNHRSSSIPNARTAVVCRRAFSSCFRADTLIPPVRQGEKGGSRLGPRRAGSSSERAAPAPPLTGNDKSASSTDSRLLYMGLEPRVGIFIRRNASDRLAFIDCLQRRRPPKRTSIYRTWSRASQVFWRNKSMGLDRDSIWRLSLTAGW